ncbi:MAG TPA: hypothetical protein VNA25_00595 [Phycisphaerae bacterium]|nr:hypothetical protein [Phycisphaerae bacterium]
MLIPQQAQRDTASRQGSSANGLAELRRRLTRPSSLTDGNRQRLLDLERRLAAVQALGDEYARVQLSEYVRAATGRGAQIITA